MNEMTAAVPADQLMPRSVPRPRPGLAAVQLDGEAVLTDEQMGAVHHLDPVGSAVWELVDGARSVAQLAAELAAAYGADRARVQADVLAFTRRLGAQGLLAGVLADPSDVGGVLAAGHGHNHNHNHGHGDTHGDGDGHRHRGGADQPAGGAPGPRYLPVPPST